MSCEVEWRPNDRVWSCNPATISPSSARSRAELDQSSLYSLFRKAAFHAAHRCVARCRSQAHRRRSHKGCPRRRIWACRSSSFPRPYWGRKERCPPNSLDKAGRDRSSPGSRPAGSRRFTPSNQRDNGNSSTSTLTHAAYTTGRPKPQPSLIASSPAIVFIATRAGSLRRAPPAASANGRCRCARDT